MHTHAHTRANIYGLLGRLSLNVRSIVYTRSYTKKGRLSVCTWVRAIAAACTPDLRFTVETWTTVKKGYLFCVHLGESYRGCAPGLRFVPEAPPLVGPVPEGGLVCFREATPLLAQDSLELLKRHRRRCRAVVVVLLLCEGRMGRTDGFTHSRLSDRRTGR